MTSPQPSEIPESARIPSTLRHPRALHFWLAVVLTGVATGIGAALLTKLLELVQHLVWRGSPTDILSAAQHAGLPRHVLILLGAALLIGAGQLLLNRLSSGNGIDTTQAIWFNAGRMPTLRTLGSAVLSVLIVGMGVSLGREGAPKQAGAVFANLFSDKERLSDEQRQLLVACGAGAGMGAAYGVPLGGALFAIEVMRGKLALRYVLPALVTSLIATAVSWLFLPDAPTYVIPSFTVTASVLVWTLVAGPLLGLASVGYVRMITWADRNRPQGWRRFTAPLIVMGLLGFTSYWFPQILGNGKDLSQLLFSSQVAPLLMLALLFLKPAAVALCMRSGAPGGMFTPSLTAGALLGGVLGIAWSAIWPGTPPGLFALLGAGAMIAATTQGPISAIVLLIELTGQDRAFILPLLLIVCSATLIARTIEPRSIYDARLTNEQIAERQRLRDLPSQ
ncbi:chloride channel protein [Terracidiphilus gabretensis]|uniref:chloride channel protein n=1 Tax=Terracidiphilus gabretensis TaxID=1577687 RepID=UPI00071BDAC4|nr:chloride channel protein [Terracidiphilus gabretensis]